MFFQNAPISILKMSDKPNPEDFIKLKNKIDSPNLKFLHSNIPNL
jgi:hypothetical protein